MTEPQFGSIVPKELAEQRDAVHVAVIVVRAAHILLPGEHVGVLNDLEDGKVSAARLGSRIGIVDPFLQAAVMPGQFFWLFLYPKTITSLRHVWEHPAFLVSAPPAESQVAHPKSKELSETWLKDFAENNSVPEYETLIKLIDLGIVGDPANYPVKGWFDGEYFHIDGRDAHAWIPPEFWDHVEIVLGRKMPSRPSNFTCAC